MVSRASDSCTTEPLPRLYLQIARGVTRFPQRPLSVERFVIGGGKDCDLQLGGEGIPDLLCMVHFDGQQTRLDAIAPAPEVKVNGRVERSAALHAGDLLQIGEFDFVVGRVGEHAVVTEVADELAADCRKLSAPELVDLIEAEQNAVDEFEAGRNAGADALLQAVAEQASHADLGAVASSQGARLHHRTGGDLSAIEHVLQGLNEFADELQTRAQRVDDRETSYADASAMLLEFQQRLSEQLEALAKRVSTFHERLEQIEQRRAIA
ncbi:MAG: hypothetical protein CMJ48_07575 [Planctomycetaceae bacterium]|nr:hypothetical protein [Planctomycetaceae bacterium]